MPSSVSRNQTPISLQGTCGRADLALTLAEGDAALARAVAEFSGFEARLKPPEREAQQQEAPASEQRVPAQTDAVVARPLAPIPFWLPVAYEPLAESEPARPAPGTPYQGWRHRPTNPPPVPPLADWRELEPRLRRLLCLPQPGGAVDLELTVRRISQGRWLAELPRERRRRWGPALQVIEDHSRRLTPYRLDQYLVQAALHRLLPAHALARRVVRDGLPALLAPPPGSILLVLGDLGCLSNAESGLRESWLRVGRDLRAGGCLPVALLPAPLERCPVRLAQVWHLIPWERPRPRDPADTPAARAERLLRLVSPAVRIEPGLLRAARLLLTPDQADAGTEADVWQHPDLTGHSAAGATLNPERARQLCAEFASRLEPGLQARFALLLRAWRGYLAEEIWFEELLNLPPAAQAATEVAQDLPDARHYFADFTRFCEGGDGLASGSDLEWFGRVERRAEGLWGDTQVGDDLKRLSYALHGEKPDYRYPAGFHPDLVHRPDRPIRRLAVRQRGEALEFGRVETHPGGSPLATLTSRNQLIQVDTIESAPEADRNAFWHSGRPPSWADDWGTDQYGPWVTFSVADPQGHRITQRMRWIAPGTFLMGSPKDEPERDSDEDPQHLVTMRRGFWLFDTACTQALWQAVMEKNPSRFPGAERPVETVSWHDCQNFLQRLNERLPGLDLDLPTEAQWEYACRAGTTTPFSFGPTITPEQVNYDGNHPYADGQKGLYRRETVPVASLPPNPWGLYEMHGNVWEWTQDHWHDSYRDVPTDGSAWVDRDTGTDRVLRGGSWYYFARFVRAAYRLQSHPGIRFDYLGFRCARVRVSPAGRQGAEPAGPARAGRRSADPRQVQPSGAAHSEPTLLRLDAVPPQDRCALPQAPAFHIRTDRECLTFRRLTQPRWASAIGRDRFGLWCEIAVDPGRGEPVVQRLRWIAPGRFWMGSPERETEGLARDEQDRAGFAREHPRHLVTLTQGYWLFDTPCTQALWEAVMGHNPSHFQSPTRPVEQVDWHDAQDFLHAINKRMPGLDLVLPSEAQWEYACRAGTETAIYSGDLEILGERNAPALDPIAWYGGNSGVEFELTNGVDSSDWKEKQYPHTGAGTRPVKLKGANPWGLYDMLGNVWEWCRDGGRDYTTDTRTNPEGSLNAGAGRVLRGGSWLNDARYVRAAYRSTDYPIERLGILGFRCARVRGEPG